MARDPGPDDCPVCGYPGTTTLKNSFSVPEIRCKGCGDFSITREALEDLILLLPKLKHRALASHVVRRMQKPGKYPALDGDFFESLSSQSLPSPAELADNLLLWIAEQVDGKRGASVYYKFSSPPLIATIGAIDDSDIDWLTGTLVSSGWIHG